MRCTLRLALLLSFFSASNLLLAKEQCKIDTSLTENNQLSILQKPEEFIDKCSADESDIAIIIGQLVFNYEQTSLATEYLKALNLDKTERSLLPSILISKFYKDVLFRRSTGRFTTPESCTLIQQKLDFFNLVADKTNIQRTTVWEDFSLIQAYYHHLLGNEAETNAKVNLIFEKIPINELPDFSLLSDVGYELNEYQLSYYIKEFDKLKRLDELAKDKENTAYYDAVLKERDLYKKQLKAASQADSLIQCN